eukprot:CAMPEP_0196588726 /NCGR_PEP_ID=MMETSP1081-20130531/61525_1 /TAXON_ID=36882 /ORGANISM="Pyramimonas amylifera, Strain CCMP720" /LENGTH=140 /DNA_ID=CAMNT_0041911319 /DNA_START=289 /DNA_END=711 /DNA_ORIENTATION=-
MRIPPPPPPALKVKHSSAYVMSEAFDRPIETKVESKGPKPSSTDNPLDQLLTSLDDSLDVAEERPNLGVKAAWTMGKMTSSAVNDPRVQKAAKATIEVGAEALKAALPVAKSLGQWAFKKGLGVMASLDEDDGNRKSKAK